MKYYLPKMSSMKPEYEVLLKEAVISKRDNLLYLKQLSSLKKEKVIPALIEIHDDVFNHTDCLSCANCCKTTPPLITKEDVNRISGHLKMSAKQFVRNYAIIDYNGEVIFKVVPCTFLASDNTCHIYDVRPEACRRYPHTNEKDFQKRVSLNVSNTLVCPAAFRIVERLKETLPLPS